jgi:hypothetical protein
MIVTAWDLAIVALMILAASLVWYARYEIEMCRITRQAIEDWLADDRDADDPEASEDLTRLAGEGVWDAEAGRFRRRET